MKKAVFCLLRELLLITLVAERCHGRRVLALGPCSYDDRKDKVREKLSGGMLVIQLT